MEYKVSDEKVKKLRYTSEELNRLIEIIGDINIDLEIDGFKCIVKYIIGQQISDKARETIWNKLKNKYEVTPLIISNLSDNELYGIGLSRNKVNYIKNVANHIINNEIDLNKLPSKSNEEIKKELTSIKGIGNWTAEMYLIFSLGRENVFSKKDGTIRRVIKWLYDLEDLPNEEILESYFIKWKGSETIVSYYFWKAIEKGLLEKKFNNYKEL